MNSHFANMYDHCLLILQVSTFILLKVLRNELGLHRCCDTRGPFYDIAFALQKMVSSPDDQRAARQLKCIIRFYLRMFHHPRFVPAVIPVVGILFSRPYLSSSANVVFVVSSVQGPCGAYKKASQHATKWDIQ